MNQIIWNRPLPQSAKFAKEMQDVAIFSHINSHIGLLLHLLMFSTLLHLLMFSMRLEQFLRLGDCGIFNSIQFKDFISFQRDKIHI